MKTIIKIVTVILFLLVPAAAFAWGPLTHVYLGNEIFYFGSMLPAGIYALMRKYRHDFLYGNLMADSIVGKKYLPAEKSSHNWAVAFGLLDSAKTSQQKAFVYGYISHLAADTVAHKKYTNGKKNVRHSLLEIKADSIVDKRYWSQAIAIDKTVQIRNDIFLEQALERFMFSFKTNKRIFKSFVLLSRLNKKRAGKSAVCAIDKLHDESLDRMIDILQNGKASLVMKENPLGSPAHRKLTGLSLN